jgi:hypothetical protein
LHWRLDVAALDSRGRDAGQDLTFDRCGSGLDAGGRIPTLAPQTGLEVHSSRAIGTSIMRKMPVIGWAVETAASFEASGAPD